MPRLLLVKWDGGGGGEGEGGIQTKSLEKQPAARDRCPQPISLGRLTPPYPTPRALCSASQAGEARRETREDRGEDGDEKEKEDEDEDEWEEQAVNLPPTRPQIESLSPASHRRRQS